MTTTKQGKRKGSSQRLPALPKAVREMTMVDDEPKTLSIIILDASISMAEHGDVPQRCVNEHIETLKNPPDGRKQYCTVIVFGEDYRALIPPIAAESLQPISNYRADGKSTLLYETVYKTLQNYLAIHSINRPENLKIFVGVFSDGDDNKSDRARQPRKVKKLAQVAQSLGWELFCFGIGIDGKALAESMGFPTDDQHCRTVKADEGGIRATTQHFSNATTTCFHLDPKLFRK